MPSGRIAAVCKTSTDHKAEYVYTNPNPKCSFHSVISIPEVIHQIYLSVVKSGHNPHQAALTLALVAGWENSIFVGKTLPDLWRNYAEFYTEWIADDD